MTKDELAALLVWYDWVGGWATIVVIVGIAGEVAVEAFFDWGKAPLHEILLIAAFGAVVGIGIVGEYFASSGITKYSNELRFIADAETATAKQRALVARKVATVARKQAIEALGRARDAELAAERERTARIALEARYAPRDLDLRARFAVTNFLRHFGEQNIDLVLYSADPEAEIFTARLVTALENAGWIVTGERRDTPGKVYGGVRVETSAEATAETFKAAEGLTTILRSEGLDVTGPFTEIQQIESGPRVIAEAGQVAVTGSNAGPTGTFRISIGRKRETLAMFGTEGIDDAAQCWAVRP